MLQQYTKQLNSEEEGFAVDVQYLDSGPQSVVMYATLYGAIVGWDLRSPTVAWKLENGLKRGVITTFCVDSHHSWLTLGTSSGFHITWDMRFQLPISEIAHPTGKKYNNNVIFSLKCVLLYAYITGARVRKVLCHPTEHSWVLSSVQGNNEISMWNLETGFREKVLWGSKTPPLSKTNVCSLDNLFLGFIFFSFTGNKSWCLRNANRLYRSFSISFSCWYRSKSTLLGFRES